MALYYVAIGGVQQVVAVIEAVLRDGIVHKVMVQVQVHHQFRGEEVIDEREIMVLLDIEFRITIGNGNRVALVNIRIQIGDSWAGDTHVVGKT